MGAFRRRLGESTGAFRDVFVNRDLRRLELAWAGSMLGTWAYGIALAVFAYEQGGASAVGLVSGGRWIAAALFAPFTALLGDRFPRQRVMVVADLLRMVALVAAALVVHGRGSPWVVYVLAGTVSVVATAFRPAQAAIVPALAETPEQLTAANVVASTIESLGIFAGPALGGILLAATSTTVVFLATAGALLWSALLLARIHPPALDRDTEGRQRGSIVHEVLAGFRTIATERKLRLLVGLFAAQTFVDGVLTVLIVVSALRLLGLGRGGVGYLNSAIGIGGLLGAVLAAGLVGHRRLAGAFGSGILIWGLPIALIGIWPNAAAALILLGAVGIGNTLVDVTGMTLMQRSAPEEVLARVFGVLESMILVTLALGSLVAPALVAGIGIRATLVLAGAILPVLALISWGRLAEIDRGAVVPAHLELLRKVPIFTPLPGPALERLALGLSELAIPAGTEVFRQGEPGDRFYVIASGEVKVTVDGKPARRLGAGEFFGEIALLRDVPRTASVRATTDVTAYTLDRDEFIPAVTGFAPSLEAADQVIGLRLGPARAGIVRA